MEAPCGNMTNNLSNIWNYEPHITVACIGNNILVIPLAYEFSIFEHSLVFSTVSRKSATHSFITLAIIFNSLSVLLFCVLFSILADGGCEFQKYLGNT